MQLLPVPVTSRPKFQSPTSCIFYFVSPTDPASLIPGVPNTSWCCAPHQLNQHPMSRVLHPGTPPQADPLLPAWAAPCAAWPPARTTPLAQGAPFSTPLPSAEKQTQADKQTRNHQADTCISAKAGEQWLSYKPIKIKIGYYNKKYWTLVKN